MSPEYQKPEPIVIENPGPLTRRTAIGSPDAPIYGANVLGGPETQALEPGQEVQTVQAVAESLGDTVLNSNVEIDVNTISPGAENPYDHLFEIEDDTEPDVAAAIEASTKTNIPGQTSLRSGYWKQPTAEQIAKGAKHGFDLSKQEKYFK